jgi:anthranilate synthase component II
MTDNKKFKILIIDNYDSFTYNLVHYFEDLDCEVTVFRNDEFEIEEVEAFNKIVLAPGPGLPVDAGLTMEILKKYFKTKSILGVCLGQQAIGQFFGANLINLEKVYHGVASKIKIIADNNLLFNNLEKEMEVGRYHSWAVDAINFPETLEITALDDHGIVMSLCHKTLDIQAVQFHPESILTPNGKQILKNWVFD